MRKLVVSTFLTLDGVMQAPGDPDEDRSGGFEHGGWQMPLFDEGSGEAVSAGMARSDAFLMGRTTYDIMAAFWPNQPDDDPIAAVMNGYTKYVVSDSLDEVEWENSTLIEGDVANGIRNVKEQPGKDIVVVGSGNLAQTLMEHDLVDEYGLLVYPLVLGTGKRLFRDGGPHTPLKLVDSSTTENGALVLRYVPVSRTGGGDTEE